MRVVRKPRHTEDTDALKAAREYVQKQLSIMREYGSAPKLSHDAYEEIVKEVADATSK